MTPRHAAALLALAISTGIATDAQAQPPDYTFVDVGHIGGGYSYPYGLNAAGQVAVQSLNATGQYHAALYSGGTLTDLTPGALQGWPEWRGINEAGHVFGRVRWTSSSCGYQAFLYYGGTTRTIPTGDCESQIRKMNKWGQVIGTTNGSGGVQRAFVYTPAGAGGTLQFISLGGNYAYAYDINDAGVVVGEARLPNGQTRAFRHDTGTGVTTDLGALGGTYSTARDINESGQIAGTVLTPSGQRAFRWTAGTMSALGTLPGGSYSEGIWIDAAGWVIGRSNSATGQYRVFRANGSTTEAVDPATATTGYPTLATDTGKVAGYFYLSGVSTYRTFVFTGGASYTFTTGGYAYPLSLSVTGHAAGYYYVDATNSSYRGFLFDASSQTFHAVTLGGPYSLVDAVNSSGWAAGYAQPPGGGNQAVIARGPQTYRLIDVVTEPAGAALYEARHISDSGYVAGYGYWNGANRAFLLVPGSTDTTAPTSTAAAEPLPNGAGWANTDVTVTITAEDDTDGSGVKEIVYSATGAGAIAQTVVAGDTAAFVVSAEGETTITYFARDNDGNEEAPKTLTVRVDKTAPSLTCATADGAWHGANVALGCTAADPVSGLANPSDAAFNLATSVAADTESANAATDSRIVCDLAGNCGTAAPIAGNKIDRKRPEITLTSPAAVNYALHQAVTADYSCADTGSGIGSCTAPVASGANVDTGTAGAKTFTVTATDAAGNTATASVTYTVLKGTPSITWAAPAPIVYGTPLGAAQLNASSPIAGTFVYTPAAGLVLGAGTHALAATFTPDDTANYDPVTTGNSIVVTPAALTITADSVSKAYGAALPSFTATTAGFVNGDTLASLTGSLTFETTATAASPVAAYPITPGGLSSPNYAIAFAPGTLTVTPVALVVAANNETRPYGAANPPFTAAISGFVNGDGADDLAGTLTFSTAATPASGVGPYPVTPGGLTSTNYAIQFADGVLTVTPAALTVSADNAVKLYGAPMPAFTASYGGFVNGDTTAALAGTLTFATDADASSPVGAYPVTPGGLTAANYQIAFVPGTLTVNAAALTVTANNASKVYGAAMPAYSASASGFVNGDTDAVLVGTLAFSTPAATDSPVGAYPITPSGVTAPNYTVAFADGTLDITPAPLTVTMASTSKVYGAPLPAFAVNYSGLTAGDVPGDLAGDLTFATTATEASGVGAYPVTPGGLSSPNYTIAFADGTLTVTPAPLVVTADAATKAYGAPLPGFTASFSGLVNGDAVASFGGVTFTTPATAGSAVGTYPITPGGVSSANYTVSFVEGTLTVTRAALTVTAQNAAKVYGEANPAFSATIVGLVNADDEGDLGGTLSYATAANAASGVGSYAVTPSGVTSPNYTVTFVDGTLTVTPAALTVTAAPAAKVYGAAMPTFTATFAGFVAGDNASDLGGTLTFATAATTASGVGAYPVTPGGLTSSNYGIAFVDGTLTVTPAPLTITADNKSMVLNGAMPALTVSYGGFVNGDGPASLGVAPTVTTDGTGTAAGVFAIVPAGAAAANYAISYVNGVLTVGYALAGNCLAGPGRTILQPINVDGSSVFKRGSTVPAKFRVCDANGVAVSAANTITLFRLIQTQAGTMTTVNEPVESTTPFSEFRWDATGQQWIFNMSTKGLSTNTTYTYRASLADGTWLDFRFGLR